jgi:phosphoribosyl 1,2-cyclic phosphodiesterase
MPTHLTILASGSSGNCALLEHDDTAILIDAGISAKKICQHLDALAIPLSRIAALLITHEHSDHVSGALQLCKSGIPLHTNSGTYQFLREKWGSRTPSAKIFQNGSPYTIGAITILPIPVAHDACDPVAFHITAGGCRIGIATDIGTPSHLVTHRLRDCHLLYLESNHDPALLQADTKRPWSVKQRILSRHGHLSNQAAARLALSLITENTTELILGHLSSDCNSVHAVRAAFAGTLAAIAAHTRITICEPNTDIPCKITLRPPSNSAAPAPTPVPFPSHGNTAPAK